MPGAVSAVLSEKSCALDIIEEMLSCPDCRTSLFLGKKGESCLPLHDPLKLLPEDYE